MPRAAMSLMLLAGFALGCSSSSSSKMVSPASGGSSGTTIQGDGSSSQHGGGGNSTRSAGGSSATGGRSGNETGGAGNEANTGGMSGSGGNGSGGKGGAMSACTSRDDCASGFVCVASDRTCAGGKGLCVAEEPCNLNSQCGFTACTGSSGEVCHCYTCQGGLSCIDDGKCFVCQSFSQTR